MTSNLADIGSLEESKWRKSSDNFSRFKFKIDLSIIRTYLLHICKKHICKSKYIIILSKRYVDFIAYHATASISPQVAEHQLL